MQDAKIIRIKSTINRKKITQKAKINVRNNQKDKEDAFFQKRSLRRRRKISFCGSIPSLNVSLKPKKIPEWFDLINFLTGNKTKDVVDRILFFNPEFEVHENNVTSDIIDQFNLINSSYEEVCFYQDSNEYYVRTKEYCFSSDLTFTQSDLELFKNQFDNDIVTILFSDLIQLIGESFSNPNMMTDYLEDMLSESEDAGTDSSMYKAMLEEIGQIEINANETIRRINSYDLSIFKDLDWFITFFHAKEYVLTAKFLHKNRDLIGLIGTFNNEINDFYYEFCPGILMTKDYDIIEEFRSYSDNGEGPNVHISKTLKEGDKISFTILHVYLDDLFSPLIDTIYAEYREINPK